MAINTLFQRPNEVQAASGGYRKMYNMGQAMNRQPLLGDPNTQTIAQDEPVAGAAPAPDQVGAAAGSFAAPAPQGPRWAPRLQGKTDEQRAQFFQRHPKIAQQQAGMGGSIAKGVAQAGVTAPPPPAPVANDPAAAEAAIDTMSSLAAVPTPLQTAPAQAPTQPQGPGYQQRLQGLQGPQRRQFLAYRPQIAQRQAALGGSTAQRVMRNRGY